MILAAKALKATKFAISNFNTISTNRIVENLVKEDLSSLTPSLSLRESSVTG